MTTSQKCRTHWRISSDVVMTSQCGSRRPNLNETKMRRRYDVPCRVGEFLFRQLMLSWTLRSIFDRPPKQWPTGRKRRKDRNTKIQYLENEKSFLDEIKSNFHCFWRVIIRWKNKNLMQIADTSFKIGYTSIMIINECENAFLPQVRRFLLPLHYKFLPWLRQSWNRSSILSPVY